MSKEISLRVKLTTQHFRPVHSNIGITSPWMLRHRARTPRANIFCQEPSHKVKIIRMCELDYSCSQLSRDIFKGYFGRIVGDMAAIELVLLSVLF